MRGTVIQALLCLLMWSGAAATHAAENYKILILGVTGYTDASLLPAHPAYLRALRSFQAELSATYDVVDHATVSLPAACTRGICSGITDTELIEQLERVRAGGTQIELLVRFGVSAATLPGAAMDKLSLRVSAGMLDLDTGQLLPSRDQSANVEHSIPPNLDDGERASWTAEQVKNIAADTAGILKTRLDHYQRQAEYILSMRGLADGESTRLQPLLRPYAVPGSYRLLDGSNTERQWLHKIANRTIQMKANHSGANLRQKIGARLDDLGISATIEYDYFRRTFTIVRVGIPYTGRYTAAALALLACLLALYAVIFYRIHHRRLRKLHANRSANLGRRYLQALKTPLPWPHQWQRWDDEWSANQRSADQARQAAEALAAEGKYEDALALLHGLESKISDSAEIPQLQAEIIRRQQGESDYQAALPLLEKDPVRAIELLQQATELNPRRADAIRKRLAVATNALRTGTVAKALREGKVALEGHEYYLAYSELTAARQVIKGLNGFTDERAELEALAAAARRQIVVLRGPVCGTGLLEGICFLVSDTLEIGRGTGLSATALLLGFRRISRQGKQARIIRNGDKFLLEDLGSSNGTWLGQDLLEAQSPRELLSSREISLGGVKSLSSRGFCRLKVLIQKNSLILRLAGAALELLDRSQASQIWPGLELDERKVWVILGQGLSLSLNDQGQNHDQSALVPGDKTNPVFCLSYHNGYEIAPIAGSTAEVRIQGVLLKVPMPLGQGTRVSVGDRSFGLRCLAAEPMEEKML